MAVGKDGITMVSKMQGKKRILVVDDEEDILTSVGLLLEKTGYEVRTANRGKAALEMLEKEKFDLVLLDILMPEMSSVEVLERIRANPATKNQKVAIFTVVQPSREGERIISNLKPVEYFQKPIEVEDFTRRIKRVLGG